MFADLVEKVITRTTSVSDTAAQRTRLVRAQEEGDSYRYQDCSAIYEEPTVRVITRTGEYLVFENQCSCPDWTNRDRCSEPARSRAASTNSPAR
jgi:hypothetical protein